MRPQSHAARTRACLCRTRRAPRSCAHLPPLPASAAPPIGSEEAQTAVPWRFPQYHGERLALKRALPFRRSTSVSVIVDHANISRFGSNGERDVVALSKLRGGVPRTRALRLNH